MRAFTEGARALSVMCSLAIDEEFRHPDAESRAAAADLVALLTPIIKALFTDLAFESTNIGMQTLGGHGYIREYGMEQYVRDARIGQIYEGTNHIQAMDLVGRKLREGNGRLLQRYAGLLSAEVVAARAVPGLAAWAGALGKAAAQLQELTMTLGMRAMSNADEAGASASDYLRFCGLVALGHMWLRISRIATERKGSGGTFDAAYYDTKVATARFFFERMFTQTAGLAGAIQAGGASVLAFPKDRF
jgi:hypothetical protein